MCHKAIRQQCKVHRCNTTCGAEHNDFASDNLKDIHLILLQRKHAFIEFIICVVFVPMLKYGSDTDIKSPEMTLTFLEPLKTSQKSVIRSA